MFGFNKKKYKKYVFTNDTYTSDDGAVLHRIVAIRDFGIIKRGTLGGYIRSESNLSHRGNCWVTYDAKVFGAASVTENAIIMGSAEVSGICTITNLARVCGESKLKGNVHCAGEAFITGTSRINGDVNIINAQIEDGYIEGNGYDTVDIRGGKFLEQPDIRHTRHFLVAGPLGSRNDFTTIFRNTFGEIAVRTGCFTGTLDEFEKAVNEEHGDNQYAKEYKALIELAKVHICLDDDPDEEE